MAEAAAHAELELLLGQLATSRALTMAGLIARLEIALFWGCACAEEVAQPPWSLVKASIEDAKWI